MLSRLVQLDGRQDARHARTNDDDSKLLVRFGYFHLLKFRFFLLGYRGPGQHA